MSAIVILKALAALAVFIGIMGIAVVVMSWLACGEDEMEDGE